MSGPIVRTGTTPKFWKNWDRIFGDEEGKSGSGGAGKKKSASASVKKTTKKKAGTKKKS